MKKVFVLITLLVCVLGASAQEYIQAQPLSQRVNSVTVKPVKPGTTRVPTITWGGDIATVLADQKGIFKSQGLNVELFREDNFAKQVEMCLSGETPYLRGTLGMITAAGDAFNAKGQELVVIYQLTWSVGGDAMVVRSGKETNNIKTVALQLYGPHMDYAANVFNKSGRLGNINFKWMKELTYPSYQTSKIVDPVSAFQSDNSLDAVMCIIPDALALTSNGNAGTGAEGSVKGATILLSTKTASRIIADVYAVRKDYYDSHRDEVEKFVKSLMLAEESLRDLRKNTSSAEYTQLISKSANLLMGASQATSDTKALLEDCEFVGYSGNIVFFTGKGTTRNIKNMNSEINTAFKTMGIIRSSVTLTSANWDYASLASGLKYATNVPAKSKPKFDKEKVTAKVEEKISVEPEQWDTEGTLFKIEVNFDPNQSTFPADRYANDFEQALEIAQTYSGALIVVEGHSDPLGILKARKAGKSRQEVSQMEQQAKNLSLQRAQSVRKSFLSYCSNKELNIDESQFVAVGFGIQTPKYNPPKTKEEWVANRRVVFRIKQVEAELDEFVPLD